MATFVVGGSSPKASSRGPPPSFMARLAKTEAAKEENLRKLQEEVQTARGAREEAERPEYLKRRDRKRRAEAGRGKRAGAEGRSQQQPKTVTIATTTQTTTTRTSRVLVRRSKSATGVHEAPQSADAPDAAKAAPVAARPRGAARTPRAARTTRTGRAPHASKATRRPAATASGEVPPTGVARVPTRRTAVARRAAPKTPGLPARTTGAPSRAPGARSGAIGYPPMGAKRAGAMAAIRATGASVPAAGIPGVGTGIPRMGTGMPAPGSGIPRVGTGIPAPGTGIPRVGTGMSAPGTGIPRMGAGLSAPGTGIPRVGPGIPRVGAGISTAETGMPRTGTEVLRVDAGMPAPGSGIPRVGPGISAPGTGIPRAGIPGAGTVIPGAGTGVPRVGTGMPVSVTGIPRVGTGMPVPVTGIPRMGTGMPPPGTVTSRAGAGIPVAGSGIHRFGAGIPAAGTGVPGVRPEISRMRTGIATVLSPVPEMPTPQTPSSMSREGTQIPGERIPKLMTRIPGAPARTTTQDVTSSPERTPLCCLPSVPPGPVEQAPEAETFASLVSTPKSGMIQRTRPASPGSSPAYRPSSAPTTPSTRASALAAPRAARAPLSTPGRRPGDSRLDRRHRRLMEGDIGRETLPNRMEWRRENLEQVSDFRKKAEDLTDKNLISEYEAETEFQQADSMKRRDMIKTLKRQQEEGAMHIQELEDEVTEVGLQYVDKVIKDVRTLRQATERENVEMQKWLGRMKLFKQLQEEGRLHEMQDSSDEEEEEEEEEEEDELMMAKSATMDIAISQRRGGADLDRDSVEDDEEVIQVIDIETKVEDILDVEGFHYAVDGLAETAESADDFAHLGMPALLQTPPLPLAAYVSLRPQTSTEDRMPPPSRHIASPPHTDALHALVETEENVEDPSAYQGTLASHVLAPYRSLRFEKPEGLLVDFEGASTAFRDPGPPQSHASSRSPRSQKPEGLTVDYEGASASLQQGAGAPHAVQKPTRTEVPVGELVDIRTPSPQAPGIPQNYAPYSTYDSPHWTEVPVGNLIDVDGAAVPPQVSPLQTAYAQPTPARTPPPQHSMRPEVLEGDLIGLFSPPPIPEFSTVYEYEDEEHTDEHSVSVTSSTQYFAPPEVPEADLLGMDEFPVVTFGTATPCAAGRCESHPYDCAPRQEISTGNMLAVWSSQGPASNRDALPDEAPGLSVLFQNPLAARNFTGDAVER